MAIKFLSQNKLTSNRLFPSNLIPIEYLVVAGGGGGGHGTSVGYEAGGG
jgi:hypothetical protein